MTLKKKTRVKKVKLKHNPQTAAQDFQKKYPNIEVCAIYGIDEFTEYLIHHLWEQPDIVFACTDINPNRLSYINRKIGQRSFSMYRWHIYSHQGFIEEPHSEVIVVAKDLILDVKNLPNPYDAELVVLEDL